LAGHFVEEGFAPVAAMVAVAPPAVAVARKSRTLAIERGRTARLRLRRRGGRQLPGAAFADLVALAAVEPGFGASLIERPRSGNSRI
jgi:hypothetical protein